MSNKNTINAAPTAPEPAESIEALRAHLQRYNNEHSVLITIAERIAQGGNLEALFAEILPLCRGVLRAGGIALLHEAGGQTAEEGPLAEAMRGHHAAILLSRPDTALETSQPEQIPPALASLQAFKSTLIMPLKANGVRYGVLWLAYDSPYAFTTLDSQFVKIVGGQLAAVLANASASAAAKHSAQSLSAILASSVDPILVADAEGKIILCNPAAEQVLAVQAEQVLGKTLESLNDGDSQAIAPLLAMIRGQSSEVIEWKGRDERYFAPRLSAMRNPDAEGQTSGHILILSDITRYRNLRENLSELASTLSHDMRTPLTYMKGYADMLPMTGSLTDKQKQFVEKIAVGIERLTDMVNKILDANRLDPEGNYQLLRETCDMMEMMQEVASTHRAAAERKGLEFETDFANNLPVINIDRTMLRRAIENLTDNAIKYTLKGKVSLRAYVRDNNLYVSVADTGVGISEENQKTAFERFRRIHRRDDTQKVKGTGLGLYIVKRIAHFHEGEVTVSSKEGEGSTFLISIPLAGKNLIGGGD
jgi:PAS domain S-box-containing protein